MAVTIPSNALYLSIYRFFNETKLGRKAVEISIWHGQPLKFSDFLKQSTHQACKRLSVRRKEKDLHTRQAEESVRKVALSQGAVHILDVVVFLQHVYKSEAFLCFRLLKRFGGSGQILQF